MCEVHICMRCTYAYICDMLLCHPTCIRRLIMCILTPYTFRRPIPAFYTCIGCTCVWGAHMCVRCRHVCEVQTCVWGADMCVRCRHVCEMHTRDILFCRPANVLMLNMYRLTPYMSQCRIPQSLLPPYMCSATYLRVCWNSHTSHTSYTQNPTLQNSIFLCWKSYNYLSVCWSIYLLYLYAENPIYRNVVWGGYDY